MSIAVNEISFNQISSLSLAEYISTEQEASQFPISCQLTSSTFQIAQQCQLEKEASAVQAFINDKDITELELVVFSDINFQQLHDLLQTSQLDLVAITAINKRNNQISYRFSVQTDKLNHAKVQLANYSLSQKIEATLIKNAPKLSQPGVLVMDMDSTTIEIECIDEIAKLAGVGEQVAEVTELAMQGELDFAQSLHQRVATLSNSSEQILEEVAENIPLMPGLEVLIKELKKHQWRIAIASGGFTYFADHLKNMLALDAAHANTLEIIDGKLTGKVIGDVVDAQAKADCLLTLQKQYDLPFGQTVAMGDGANDLVMMEAAHYGVAFHAKPIVLKQADSAINYSGLDCLIHWLA